MSRSSSELEGESENVGQHVWNRLISQPDAEWSPISGWRAMCTAISRYTRTEELWSVAPNDFSSCPHIHLLCYWWAQARTPLPFIHYRGNGIFYVYCKFRINRKIHSCNDWTYRIIAQKTKIDKIKDSETVHSKWNRSELICGAVSMDAGVAKQLREIWIGNIHSSGEPHFYV